MQIHITQSVAPHIPKEIIKELEALTPRVFMQWNPRLYKVNDHKGIHYEGRWDSSPSLSDLWSARMSVT